MKTGGRVRMHASAHARSQARRPADRQSLHCTVRPGRRPHALRSCARAAHISAELPQRWVRGVHAARKHKVSHAPCSSTLSRSPPLSITRPWHSPMPSNHLNRHAPLRARSQGRHCRKRTKTKLQQRWRTCCTAPHGPSVQMRSPARVPRRSHLNIWPWTWQTSRCFPPPPAQTWSAAVPSLRQVKALQHWAPELAWGQPPSAVAQVLACWPRFQARQSQSRTQSAWPSALTQRQNLPPSLGMAPLSSQLVERRMAPPAPGRQPYARPRSSVPPLRALAVLAPLGRSARRRART
mmetsp:Transcript_29907/g.93528  ORF Transcript_29907/g.93528 Transcript_29907/m.93528 type:complete len:294 (+) Transcript_29907:1-882(+)